MLGLVSFRVMPRAEGRFAQRAPTRHTRKFHARDAPGLRMLPSLLAARAVQLHAPGVTGGRRRMRQRQLAR